LANIVLSAVVVKSASASLWLAALVALTVALAASARAAQAAQARSDKLCLGGMVPVLRARGSRHWWRTVRGATMRFGGSASSGPAATPTRFTDTPIRCPPRARPAPSTAASTSSFAIASLAFAPPRFDPVG